jgi:hypothetical protein
MTTAFEKYSDVLLDAFCENLRAIELAQKKTEVLDDLIDANDLDIHSVLYFGFSPSILNTSINKIFVTEIGPDVRDHLDQKKIVYTYVDRKNLKPNMCDLVVAFDEYFTFAETDTDQKNLVDLLCSVGIKAVVTTLRDYKNQDFKDREFSQPILIKNSNSKKIYLEHYEYNISDRNSFTSTNYIIIDDGCVVIGPFDRRNMFFKQLAKFSLDAGASNFLIHKNLMHKSIIKKSYEYIITIKL